jgi:hypothetical protein
VSTYRILMFGAAICNALAAAVMLTAWIVKDQPAKPSVINVTSIADMKETPRGIVKPGN